MPFWEEILHEPASEPREPQKDEVEQDVHHENESGDGDHRNEEPHQRPHCGYSHRSCAPLETEKIRSQKGTDQRKRKSPNTKSISPFVLACVAVLVAVSAQSVVLAESCVHIKSMCYLKRPFEVAHTGPRPLRRRCF